MILKLGDRHEDVKLLQRLLRVNGYTVLVDGIFGYGTLEAVKKFQNKNGLLVDGIVGDNTLNGLKKSIIKKKPVKQTKKVVKYKKPVIITEEFDNGGRLWLLDPGHGGLINGKYQTAGKRSPLWEDGSQYFEGVGNRDIVRRIAESLDKLKIRYEFIVEPDNGKDVSLPQRVKIANNIYKKDKSAVYISVHSNGASAESAKGWEVFTFKGQTESDKIATAFYDAIKKEFPNKKFRKDMKDGDPDKEANFYVLKHTNMSSVLTENFFHTNKEECDLLNSEEGRQKIADVHVDAIVKYNKIKNK